MTYMDPNLVPARHSGGNIAQCPVEPGQRLRPHKDFGRRFIIFVDTEEEFDWKADFSRAANSTAAISALKEATARFNGYGVHPVYLCDYPVITRPESRLIIKDLAQSGACDVGAHLHPWVNPPHDEAMVQRNSFTGNLPVALQREKLRRLTTALAELTGKSPTVFRAGRYGLGSETMSHLVELGYRMDVSVRSLFDYSSEDGPNYADCPVWPWRTPEGIVELPLTSGWTGRLRKFPALYRSRTLHGALAKTALLTRVPLTPEGTPVKQAIEAIEALLEDGLDIFSLSFHSPTLAVGHTPYARNGSDLTRFWDWWDAIFKAFDRLGVTPVRYDALADALCGAE
jgi:hypothetical protein